MKKLLILAAMAGVALVSCVKNEPAPSVTDQHEITFAPPVVGVNTRSVDLVTTANITGSFSVYGYYHPSEYPGFDNEATYTYMENVEVTKDDDFYEDQNGTKYPSWVTSSTNDYYWPKTGKMTFVAYYPSLTNTTDDSQDNYVAHTINGIQFKNYVVGDKADVDLMFSDRAYDQTKATNEKLNTPSNYYGVELSFKHALSAIRFKFKAASDLVDNNGGPKYTFVVQEVVLKNVHSKGNFNQGLNESGNAKASTGVAATTDWSTNTIRNYTAYSGDGLTINSTDLVASYDVADGKTNGANLILLPQTLEHDGTDGTVTVQVKYKLKHDKMETDKWIENNYVEAELSTNAIESWLRGNIYTYNITLNLDKIEFAPKVDEWIDSQSAEVTVENQVTNP